MKHYGWRHFTLCVMCGIAPFFFVGLALPFVVHRVSRSGGVTLNLSNEAILVVMAPLLAVSAKTISVLRNKPQPQTKEVCEMILIGTVFSLVLLVGPVLAPLLRRLLFG